MIILISNTTSSRRPCVCVCVCAKSRLSRAPHRLIRSHPSDRLRCSSSVLLYSPKTDLVSKGEHVCIATSIAADICLAYKRVYESGASSLSPRISSLALILTGRRCIGFYR